MFEKNLEALQKINPHLAKKLRSVSISNRVTLFLSGPHEDVNIAYDNIALHQMEDPMGEALEVFENEVRPETRTDQTLLFIFGMGLGYLLRRAFVNSDCQIIVYEPYLEVLRQTLEAVDFTQELLSRRVSIITELSEISPMLGGMYLMGDAMHTFALPAYRIKEPQLFIQVLDALKDAMHVNFIGQNTALKMMEKFARSALQNLPDILRYPEVSLLHDKFAGIPGVVVSAGPSLDKPGVLDTLKAHRGHFIISCVGQALRALDKAGIQPDFVNALEHKNISQQFNGVSYLEDLNLILLPQANQRIYKLPTRRKLISHSNKDPLTNWLSHALGESLFGYNHQGTVSITALLHLMKMGCNPIFLLGQDLAYPEGQAYASNAVYQGYRFIMDENGKIEDITMENIHEFVGEGKFFKSVEDFKSRKKRFEARMVKTKGWHGETLYTSTNYASYRKAFELIASSCPTFELVNCSEGGAFIEGFEHLAFPEALKKYDVSSYQGHNLFESYLQEHYQEWEPGSAPFQKVYQQYLKDRQELDSLQTLSQEGIDKVNKALDELNTKNTLTHSLESRLKKLSDIDNAITQLTQNNPLINYYVKTEMFQFSKTYGRKLIRSENDTAVGDVAEMKENLEQTRHLYEAVLSGASKLIETLDPVFQDFPASEPVMLMEK